MPDLDIAGNGLLQLGHRYGDRLGPLVEAIEVWLGGLDGQDPVSNIHTK